MAKRTQRQLIVDRLERAVREIDNAKILLMECGMMYAEGGYDQGQLLIPIVEALQVTRDAAYQFRVEVA
jgi:hypothetical protein